MTLLLKMELHRTISVVNGSSLERGNTIVVAESVKRFACVSAGRFLARTMCDPSHARIGLVNDQVVGRRQLPLNRLC